MSLIDTVFRGRAQHKKLDEDVQRAHKELQQKTQDCGNAAEEAVASIRAECDRRANEKDAEASKAKKESAKK